MRACMEKMGERPPSPAAYVRRRQEEMPTVARKIAIGFPPAVTYI
jgi:hypothetical protein